MATDLKTISDSDAAWQSATMEAAQWSEQIGDLANQLQSHLAATESVAQLRIAVTLAQSASQATGTKAKKLRRAAVDAAQKAAKLTQLVIFDLSKTAKPGVRDQILAWSKALAVADKLATLPIETTPMTKKWWEFWK